MVSQDVTVDRDVPERFAFGLDQLQADDGEVCGCPVISYGVMVGKDPLPMDEVVAEYDKILKVEHNENRGIVDEEMAREAWLSAIDTCVHDEYKSDFHVDNARRLADDFGWL